MSKSKEPPFDAEYLRSVLDYDPATGEFRWKWRDDVRPEWNTRYAGKIAGSSHNAGYQSLRINDRAYLSHRIAFFYCYGVWPDEVDHRDRDRSNNRIANLREATSSQNLMNRGLQSNNTSGVAGVRWDTARQKWTAGLKLGGRKVFQKRYDTFEEAVHARTKAEEKFFGEFRLGLEPQP